MKVHLQRLLCATLICYLSIGLSSKINAQDLVFCQDLSITGNVGTLEVYAAYTGTNTDEAMAAYGLSIYFDGASLDFLSIEYEQSLWDEAYYELNPFVELDSKTIDGENYNQYLYASGEDMKPSTKDTRIGASPVLLFKIHFKTDGSNFLATAVGTSEDAAAFYDHYNGTCFDVIVKTSESLQAQVKLFLQGALSGSMMNTALSPSLLPLSHPYSNTPYNYTGTESVSSMPSNIVDWVLIELRAENDNTQVVARKAALLQADGNVVDVNGSTTLTFDGINPGQYYLSVHHRNHLGIMSATALDFSTSSN